MTDTPSSLLVDGDLRLRRPCLDDEAMWNELRQLPEIARRVGLRSLVDESGAWEKWGRGVFVIEDVAGPSFVGVAGLAEPYRCLGRHLLCAVLPRWRGRGRDDRESRALRVCRQLLRWADDHSETVYAHVDTENRAGLRLVQLLGGTATTPTAPGMMPSVSQADFVFARTRP